MIGIEPVGRVRSPIDDAVDDVWGGLTVRIELDAKRFTAESLAGLDAF